MAASEKNSLPWIIKYWFCLWKSLETPFSLLFFLFLGYCILNSDVLIEKNTVLLSEEHRFPSSLSFPCSQLSLQISFPHFLMEVSAVPWHHCYSCSKLSVPGMCVCVHPCIFSLPWWVLNLWKDMFRWDWIGRFLINIHLLSVF